MGIDLMREDFTPDVAIPPGETLREVLEYLGIRQNDLAERLKRPEKTISELIHGKTAITAETAVQLEQVLGISASFWANLETNYQITKARLESRKRLASQISQAGRFPYAEMATKGWVKRTRDRIERVSELLGFFGVTSFDALDRSRWPAYRIGRGKDVAEEAILAWLQQGERQARQLPTESFSESGFRSALLKVRELTRDVPESFVGRLQNLAAQNGVAIVFVPYLSKTYVNGASQWLSSKAVIHLSDRYKYADVLWFTFFHEAGHLLLHGKARRFVDFWERKDDVRERQADKFAADILIPPGEYIKFCETGDFSRGRVESFAEKIGISAGTVVGRLHHDQRILHSSLNELRCKLCL